MEESKYFSAWQSRAWEMGKPGMVHVQKGGGGGWQAVSLGGGVTVMEKRKFW